MSSLKKCGIPRMPQSNKNGRRHMRSLLPLLSRAACLAAALAFLLSASASFAGDPAQSDGLILIKGGTFLMGSPESERQRQRDELRHEVLVSDFYVDPYEVRQDSYERIMGSNPSHFRGKDLPVENVTWFDAVEYCNRLSESAGLSPVYRVSGSSVSWDRSANGYRLLTEAEWEYAARAGAQKIFQDGDQTHSDEYNFEGSYPYLIEENYVRHRDPSVVASRFR